MGKKLPIIFFIGGQKGLIYRISIINSLSFDNC